MALLFAVAFAATLALAQSARPTPPTRDPNTPGYVAAKELPDGTVPPPTADGNFIIGPTHNPAPETMAQESVPQGATYNFTMSSADSKIYPGIARDAGTFGTADPNDPAKLIVTTSHPAPYERKIAVYVPKQYVPGTVGPFIVGADGPDPLLFTTLDNLIAQKRVPPMIAISIGNGSGDAQGSQRGLEYDTMSGRYAEFVESEVLPLVEKQYDVKLTKNPEGRATMGCSSGAAAALSMAWYHPELYHRVLSYSGTYVNQQWPSNPETPHGAWEYHERLIPNSPVKPIRTLDAGRRPGSVQSQPDARQHARLGRREREHGQGARGQGLSLPVRVQPQRRTLRSAGEAPDVTRRARMAVAGVRRLMKIVDLRVTVVGTPWRELVFLELTTDDGLTGVSEVRMVNKTDTLVACIGELAPRYVIGTDPFDVERLAWNVQRAEYGRPAR